MPDAVLVVTDAIDVQSHLRSLGVSQDILLDAVRDGESAKASCTANHPPTFAGMARHAETVRSLRDALLPLGWTRDDRLNFSTVVRADGALAIAVARGDEDTGNPIETPSTKYPRGTTTLEAIDRNLRLPWDEMAIAYNAMPPSSEREASTWFLLHSRVQNEIRCELSRPTAIDALGYIDGWSERLILTAIPLEPVPISEPDDELVETTVEVRRRVAI